MTRKISVLWRLPNLLRTIARELRDTDAVYVPLPGDIPLLGLLVAVCMRKRTVVRYCGSWDSNSQTTVMNRVTKNLMKILAGKRHVMFATGARQGSAAKKISWIYATAITRDERERLRPDLDKASGTPLQFVYVGRLSPEKGLLYLLDAFGQIVELQAQNAPILHLIGSGPLRGKLEEGIHSGSLTKHVRLWGQLGRNDLMLTLRGMDVAVMPSLSEGYNKALLDCMLLGLPAISTVAGSAREMVGAQGERGWLVPCGDAKALRDAMLSLSQAHFDWPPLRRRCHDYAAQRTLETWASAIRDRALREWQITDRPRGIAE